MYTKEKLTQEINTIIIDKLGVEPNEHWNESLIEK